MTTFYADTSALARAYLPDEPDHISLRALLLEGGEQVVVSEIGRLELTAAVQSAARAGRVRDPRRALAGIEADYAERGPIVLLALEPEVAFPTARRLLLEHRLRTLDAVHLAVALEQVSAWAAGDDVVLVTRDAAQAEAAHALGLAVR